MTNFTLTPLLPSPQDPRDYKFSSLYTGELPPAVWLSDPTDQMEDQQSIGSCTCNSTLSALEIMLNRAGQPQDLSRLFAYYEVRKMENGLDSEGAALRDVFKIGRTVGIAPESEWAYDISQENVQPPQSAYTAAAKQRIGSYEAVTLVSDGTITGMMDSVHNIKMALAQGLPVVIASVIYRWWFYLKGPWAQHSTLPVQIPGYMDAVGRHAILIVGYDDTINGGSFIIQNSWGKAWGNNGYGAINYTCVGDIFEAWVVRGFMRTHMPYSIEQKQIMQLYVGIFGHAPTVSELTTWIARLKNFSMPHVADEMYQQSAARKYYPAGISHNNMLIQFYFNVLGRMPDTGGLAYWMNKFDNGCSEGDVLCMIMGAIDNYSDSNADGAASKVLFDNKTDVALYCTVALACNDTAIAQSALDGVSHSRDSVNAVMDRLINQVLK